MDRSVEDDVVSSLRGGVVVGNGTWKGEGGGGEDETVWGCECLGRLGEEEEDVDVEEEEDLVLVLASFLRKALTWRVLVKR